jgi:uncharacterized damage-inducible protein DinB
MIVEEIARTEPPFVGGEREQLEAWLDYHRATLLWKCQGLSEEQLKLCAAAPATLSLLGLVQHMTEVENGWFGGFAGAPKPPRYYTEEHPDDDLEVVKDADAAAVVAAFRAECADSRRLAAGRGLDETFVHRRGATISLRWIYIHMIEEYARHNGHADLIRQAVDGAVGD